MKNNKEEDMGGWEYTDMEKIGSFSSKDYRGQLYLGTYFSAKNIPNLKKHRIKNVVSCQNRPDLKKVITGFLENDIGQ